MPNFGESPLAGKMAEFKKGMAEGDGPPEDTPPDGGEKSKEMESPLIKLTNEGNEYELDLDNETIMLTMQDGKSMMKELTGDKAKKIASALLSGAPEDAKALLEKIAGIKAEQAKGSYEMSPEEKKNAMWKKAGPFKKEEESSEGEEE